LDEVTALFERLNTVPATVAVPEAPVTAVPVAAFKTVN
jgi:hypothetical protein